MTIGSRLIVGVVIVLVVGAAIPAGAGEDNVKFEEGKLYVDGKPFIFWGFIWRSGINSFEEMSKFGFNGCLAQRRTGQGEFDEAREHGVYLMMNSSTPHAWIVRHPALVAYFLGDDLATAEHLEKIKARVARVRAADQTHPTLGDVIGLPKKFMEYLDIYAPYRYPLPLQTYRWYFEEFLDGNREAVGHKYLWTAMQSASIHSSHGRKGFAWGDMYRFPAPGQFRLLCWGALAHGVRGFMFWKDTGLLPPDMDNGDRTAEAVIIAHELQIIGDEIAGGDDIMRGASCADPDIDVGRIDLPGHTILIASVIREGYQWAIDQGFAEVEITLPRPAQLEGELRAYSFGFPRLEPVPLREEDGKLIVGPHSVEICDTIVIEEAGACQTQHAAQIKEHLPAVAATTQSLLRYQHEKMDYVNRHLVTLKVDVPAARAAFHEAVVLRGKSAAEFDRGNFGLSFTIAREAQRHYRLMLYRYREYAAQFQKHAPEPMHLYLMMPYGLPKYFASFDHTAVNTGK